MSMVTIGGVDVPDPSSWEWTEQDVSGSDAGRDETGLMHKDTICQKASLALAWAALTPAQARTVIGALKSSEYLTVRFRDPATAADVTKTMYAGNRTAKIAQWWSGGERFSSVGCTLIEQ